MSSPPEDPVSPELAVVDPGLRAQLASESPQAASGATRARRSRRRGRSRLAVALVLLVALLVAGVATTVLIRRADTPASTAAPIARDFAWAPVTGATAYDVEIRRDDAIVYSTRTTAPHVRVPAQWTRGAQTFALTPGTYRWYVWPVKRSGTGARRSPAVVATTFEVTRP